MAANRTTLTEAELRKRVEAGESHMSIAFSIGRHASTIAAACMVLGITRGITRRTDPVERRIKKLEAALATLRAAQ